METKKYRALRDSGAKILDDEMSKEIQKKSFLFEDGLLQVNPGGWILPGRYLEFAHYTFDFNFTDQDILITSMPKSGTTWMQEITWNLLYNPDGNHPHATLSSDFRSPNLALGIGLSKNKLVPQLTDYDELIAQYDKIFPGCRKIAGHGEDYVGMLYDMFSRMPAPRVYKNHMPLSLMPENLLEKSKVIYIARNVFDTVVSFYHFSRLHFHGQFIGTLDEFVDYFVAEKYLLGPFFKHIKEAWDLRDNPNLLFIFYEDLKGDPVKEITKIDQFLGTNRTDKQIKQVADFTSFANLKERFKENPPTSNYLQDFDKELMEKEGLSFFRKGQVGDWKNHLSVAQHSKLKKYADEKLKMFGKDFKYNQF